MRVRVTPTYESQTRRAVGVEAPEVVEDRGVLDRVRPGAGDRGTRRRDVVTRTRTR